MKSANLSVHEMVSTTDVTKAVREAFDETPEEVVEGEMEVEVDQEEGAEEEEVEMVTIVLHQTRVGCCNE